MDPFGKHWCIQMVDPGIFQSWILLDPGGGSWGIQWILVDLSSGSLWIVVVDIAESTLWILVDPSGGSK